MLAWYLESYEGDGSLHCRQSISVMPFSVGRTGDNSLVINSNDVSRRHAQFTVSAGRMILTDLGSTNGTWVNHQHLTEAEEVFHGDVIHFGNVEFRVIRQDVPLDVNADEGTIVGDRTRLADKVRGGQLAIGARELAKMLENREVDVYYQPMVDSAGDYQAMEALGRGAMANLPWNPGELFELAHSLGLAPELSQLFRETALHLVTGETELPLFLNVHPEELKDLDTLGNSLVALREQYSHQKIVLEIHEDVVTNIERMLPFVKRLRDNDIDLAYDDFGAGQARLLELVELPPRYLKFDSKMVRGLSTASDQKLHLLEALMKLSHDLGIVTIAECVETFDDAHTCNQLGFDLVQGFVYSKPRPWTEFRRPWRTPRHAVASQLYS